MKCANTINYIALKHSRGNVCGHYIFSKALGAVGKIIKVELFGPGQRVECALIRMRAPCLELPSLKYCISLGQLQKCCTDQT